MFLALRGSRRRLLRLTSLAVLFLQGAMALSPLAEPRDEARLSAHAEQDGTRHVNLHNEATCVLCSARAQTSMPAPVPEPLATSQDLSPRSRPLCGAIEGRRVDQPLSRPAPPPLLTRSSGTTPWRSLG